MPLKKVGMQISDRFGKLLLVLIIGSLLMPAFAESKLPSKEQIGLFMNSTTCVVLENGSISYNVYIKEAVEKHWKITGFEFIDRKEFEERRFMTKYSFLMLVEGTFEDDPAGVSYNFLNLLMGGGAADVNDMPELVSIPLSYKDNASADYGYAIPSMVNFVQKHVRFIQSRRLSAALFGLKFYNRSREIKDKALLLMPDQMAEEVNTLSKIKNAYPFYVRLVTLPEMEKILSGSPENTLLLYHVGPAGNDNAGRCFEMIFTPEGELYYYNYRDITNEKDDGFTKIDLRRIRF